MIEGVATLEALETWWSIDDVVLRNEALDAWAEAEREAQKKKG